MTRTDMTVIILAVALWSAPAYAYLDPGTGSMILQLLLGGVAGAAVIGRLYWSKLTSVLGFRKKASAPPANRAKV
jgi:hypothetical protein